MIMIRRKRSRKPGSPTEFSAGELVRHRRYGYRGVVVDLDLECTAPDSWYEKNQTQPDRSQPWYHVLVHESVQTTYAAQENLMPDFEDAPILHPLVQHYFDSFANGVYLRNDRPWGSI